ncbi:hypothetical protein HN51_066906 [Arachis hypogaea]
MRPYLLKRERRFILVDAPSSVLDGCGSFLHQGQAGMIKGLKKPMLSLMTITSINWLAWSMIFMYISDWMGRKVYGEKPGIKVDTVYDTGYRYRNCGLMLTWLVMGAMSLAVVHIARAFGGAKNLWGAGNFILVGGLAMTVYISNLAKDERLERHLDLRF